MGQQEAIFLCKFLAKIVLDYGKIQKQFVDDIFIKVLTTTMLQFVQEDI